MKSRIEPPRRWPGAEFSRAETRARDWMADSLRLMRDAFPDMEYTFSLCTRFKNWAAQDVSMLDFLEPHIWMANRETSDFYDKIDCNHELFDPRGRNNIVARGQAEYKANKAYYDGKLLGEIENVAAWSRASGKPLVTTECWSLVDYKDWPGLDRGLDQGPEGYGGRARRSAGSLDRNGHLKLLRTTVSRDVARCRVARSAHRADQIVCPRSRTPEIDMTRVRSARPRAITMWDFSWIERRWPGAGYEDWDRALDELVERGYDAVRIDAFPHFLSADPNKRWLSLACGQDGDWGSPSEVAIGVKDKLLEFIDRCRERGVVVGLSTWYKDDPEHVRSGLRECRARPAVRLG